MGVAVGLGVAVAVMVGVGTAELEADGVTVAGCEALDVADEVGPVPVLADPARELDVASCDDGTVAVPLATVLGGDPDVVAPTEGEKIDGTEEEPPPLQADTDPESRTVAAAQPTAVSLPLLTLMRPPRLPGWQRR
jgi:hypothetical protein